MNRLKRHTAILIGCTLTLLISIGVAGSVFYTYHNEYAFSVWLSNLSVGLLSTEGLVVVIAWLRQWSRR